MTYCEKCLAGLGLRRAAVVVLRQVDASIAYKAVIGVCGPHYHGPGAKVYRDLGWART